MEFFKKMTSVLSGENRESRPLNKEEEIHERVERRKSAFIRHCDRILAYQQELAEVKKQVFQIDKKNLAKSSSVALQVLAGSSVVASSPFLRGFIDPYIGAAASFFGTQVATHGVLEALDYFSPTSRETVDTARKKRQLPHRKTEEQSEEEQAVSEHSLRMGMIQLQFDTIAQSRKDMVALSKRYKSAQEEFDVGEAKNEYAFLQRRKEYMDTIIAAQEKLLNSMVDAHILSSLHENARTRKTLGFASAAAVLEGTSAVAREHTGTIGHVIDAIGQFFSSLGAGKAAGAESTQVMSGLMPTLAALASGLGLQAYAESREKKDSREIARLLHLISEEIDALNKSRLKTALRIQTLSEKIQEEGRAVAALPVHALDVQLEGLSQSTLADDLARSLDAVLGRSFEKARNADETQKSVVVTEHIPPWAPTLESLFEPSWYTEEEQTKELKSEAPEIIPRVYEVEPAVKPLDRRTLVELTALPSIDRKIVHDIFLLVHRDYSIDAKEFKGDPAIVVSALESVAQSDEVSVQELEDVLDYLEKMDTTLRANESILDFSRGHLRTILENRKKIEEGLEKRERETVAHVLKMIPHKMREYVLDRWHIGASAESVEIHQEAFESRLRAWMHSDRTRNRDRASIQRFLEICEKELQQLPTNVYQRSEKETIIGKALRILQEHVSDAAFSSSKNMRFQEERMAALEPIVASYVSLRDEQKIPGIGMIGRLSYESFVQSDDMHEISYDHKKEERDVGLRNIACDAIIGSYLASGTLGGRMGWIAEASSEEKRVMEYVHNVISKDAHIETFDEFFFDPSSGKERIEVWRIPGVGGYGPLFFVMRGIQYVTAAKIAGMPRIVARVKEVRQPNPSMPLEIVTSNLNRYAQLKKLKSAGLIDGEFLDTFSINESSVHTAKIKQQVLPWLMWFSIQNIPALCSVYESLHPESLDKLRTLTGDPIVKDALLKGGPVLSNYLNKKRSGSA